MKPDLVNKCLIDGFPVLSDVVPEVVGGNLVHKIYTTSDFGEVKPCSACKKLKPVRDFHKDSSSKTGLTYNCTPCALENSKSSYGRSRSKPGFLEARRESYSKIAAERKRKAVEYMGDKCQDCNQQFQDCVYDFHHLDGNTKTDNPSAVLKRPWDQAKKELDLCVLLCSNCHRVRHFGKT